MATIYKPIITRIDTTANWTTLNPVPANGEQCIEILGGGLFKLKIGDGVTPWIALNYYSGSSGSAEDLSKLITPDKSSLVAAINSVQVQVNALAAKLASLSNVATSGDYNDLINKLIAGENITIDENNVISATGVTPPPYEPIDEYDPSTEGLEIHQIIVVSDENGDLVLDGVNGEIIPIYDEEPDHEIDIDGNIIYEGGIQVVSDTEGELVLDNVNGAIIPIYDEGGGEIDIDGNIIYDGDIQVVSDSNENLVLDNVNNEIIPIEDTSSDETYHNGDVILNNMEVISDTDGNIVLNDPRITPGE